MFTSTNAQLWNYPIDGRYTRYAIGDGELSAKAPIRARTDLLFEYTFPKHLYLVDMAEILIL